MAEPLHSSFTLRPCGGGGAEQQPVLTFTESSSEENFPSNKANTVDLPKSRPCSHDSSSLVPPLLPDPPAIKRSFTPFASIEQRRLPSSYYHTTCTTTTSTRDNRRSAIQNEFEPPDAEHYWKKRCFQWQQVCQSTRKRIREMEEDQRQLRRRIWQLEERLSTTYQHPSVVSAQQQQQPTLWDSNKVPVSPTSVEGRRPPALIITIPKGENRHCCFYLTDSEGLSDTEDYADEIERDCDDQEDVKDGEHPHCAAI